MFDNTSDASAYVLGVLDLLGEMVPGFVQGQSQEDIKTAIEAASALDVPVGYGVNQESDTDQFVVFAYDTDTIYQDPEL